MVARTYAQFPGRCPQCREPFEVGAAIYKLKATDRRRWCCSAACAMLYGTPRGEEGQQRSQAPPQGSTRAAELWPARILREIPTEWRKRAYRALAAVLHPDRGGDTTLCASLNTERDRLGDA